MRDDAPEPAVSVRLVPVTLTHLDSYRRDPAQLAALLGSDLPDGWPEFPEAIDFTHERLTSHPGEAGWWMQLFLDSSTSHLVGSGGFAGPPQDRTVEIGYEVAPAFRGRGYGTAVVAALRDRAVAAGSVDVVLAHTLAIESGSTGALRRCGFALVEAFVDPHDGDVWQWRWSRR